jgi:NADPH:quinone reductase
MRSGRADIPGTLRRPLAPPARHPFAAAMVVCVRVHEAGGPEQLRVEDCALPLPGRGEVRLAHTAIGVNFVDCHHRAGRAPLPAWPHGLGIEAVGVVEALGDGVNGPPLGTRLGYAAGGAPGAYASHANVPAWRLVPVPDDVDDVTAAAVLCKGLTAEMLVRRVFKVGPGHRVLVHAAAGGVGALLCQWLRHQGAMVIGAVSSPAKAELARRSGCHQVVVTTAESVVEVVQAITQQRGLDVVYDGVGRDTFAVSLACLRKRGLLVMHGHASGLPDPIDVARLQSGSWFVTRPVLTDYTATRQELLHAAEVLWKVVRGGVLRPHVDVVLPLAEVATAHRRLEARQSAGSIVLRP